MAGAPPPVHRCAERLCMRQLELLVTTALRELTGEKTMEAVLAHENILLDELGPSGSARDDMEPLIAARRFSDRPTVVHRQDQFYLLIQG